MLVLPLLILFVSGCLSAPLDDTNYTTSYGSGSSPPSQDTLVETRLLDVVTSMSPVASTVVVGGTTGTKINIPDDCDIDGDGDNHCDDKVAATNSSSIQDVSLPTTTSTTMSPQDPTTSAGSIMTTPATPIKALTTEDYGVITNSSMGTATVMKPMPTQTYGVPANSSAATVMKPMLTQGYGVSANSSMTTGAIIPTTKASNGTPSGIITTTAAPKKNGSPSTSVSIFLSVAPVVLSLLLNH